MQDEGLTQRIYRCDRLPHRFVQHLVDGQAVVIIAIALLMFVVTLAPALLGLSTFHRSELGVDLVESFIIFPIGLLLYFETPKFISRLFTELRFSVDEKDQNNRKTYDEFLTDLIKTLNNTGWIVVELILILGYWIYRLYGNVPADLTLSIAQPGPRTIFRVALLTIYSFVAYTGLLGLYRLVIAAIYTGKLFRAFRLLVNPLSPDGAGGIGIVGQALTVSTLIFTTFGVAATIMIYINLINRLNPFGRPEIAALGIVYIVSIPFLLINWLWYPHQALINAREKVLKPLADEFKFATTKDTPLTGETTETIRAGTDRLIEIKKQYELLKDTFPVWPLQIQPLRNLLTTSVLPAITALLSKPVLALWDGLLAFLNSKH